MSKYAFFDVDQTIYDGYSTMDFYRFLVTKGIGGEWVEAKDKDITRLYESGEIDYSEAGKRVVELLAEVVKDQPVADISKLADEFVSTQNKIKPFVPELFSLLRENQYKIICVSASPEPNVGAISRAAQAGDYFSSSLEIINDHYSGLVTHQLDNEEKTASIKKIIQENSPTSILGFGDSTGDIPMLTLAQQAFVIDPHQDEMKEVAASHGWNLVNESTIIDQVRKWLVGELA